MSEQQIRIEGSPEDLERLRRDLVTEMGDEAKVQPVSSSAPGELREPLLVALVIALGPAAIDAFAQVVNRYMEHRERMEELRLYRGGEGEEPISLSDLRPEEATG